MTGCSYFPVAPSSLHKNLIILLKYFNVGFYDYDYSVAKCEDGLEWGKRGKADGFTSLHPTPLHPTSLHLGEHARLRRLLCSLRPESGYVVRAAPTTINTKKGKKKRQKKRKPSTGRVRLQCPQLDLSPSRR